MIGNAMWKGARLADVLKLAGLRAAAVEIKMTSADGYHTSIPAALATHPDSLLAYEMNGVALPNEHGSPVRCLFPGRYGTKQPKWITVIEAVTQPYIGYWERQGWSNDAIVRINSRIVTPSANEVIAAPTYPISGVVFSNDAGVRKLEVSTDGGQTWHDANLVRGPSPLAWSEWRYDWPTPPSGAYVVIARATDNEGNQQPLAGSRQLVPDDSREGLWTAAHVTAAVKK
jgi:DMSO/TMAO reductase YedYZ molybdopterin-dependent catalytic subunit